MGDSKRPIHHLITQTLSYGTPLGNLTPLQWGQYTESHPLGTRMRQGVPGSHVLTSIYRRSEDEDWWLLRGVVKLTSFVHPGATVFPVPFLQRVLYRYANSVAPSFQEALRTFAEACADREACFWTVPKQPTRTSSGVFESIFSFNIIPKAADRDSFYNYDPRLDHYLLGQHREHNWMATQSHPELSSEQDYSWTAQQTDEDDPSGMVDSLQALSLDPKLEEPAETNR